MGSTLRYVTSDELKAVMPDIRKSGFVGEIDLAHIKNDNDYLNAIASVFRFPAFEGQVGHSWNGYFDWMTDLCWENDAEWLKITEKGFNLIIYNCNINGYTHRFDGLLKRIVDSFVYDILPWWDKDVEDCVTDGKSKPFNVYLVL